MNTIELLFSNIKRIFSLFIGLISFTVGTVADEGADIVIRALPLATPMPNAISVFWVSQTTLRFSWWQALAFAATIEFALFGLFEVTLIMFDGYQARPTRYKWPFLIAVSVSLLVLVMIVIIVYQIENAHTVLASLPLLSAAGATALALKRWHMRNSAAEKPQSIAAFPQTIVEQLQESVDDPIAKMHAARQAKIAQRRDKILHIAGTEELSIEQLVERLKVSDRIIKSDLKVLQEAGHTMSINGVVKLV